ncbi:MAG: GntR family transcriptional regulator [Pseudomonadota bacterium]
MRAPAVTADKPLPRYLTIERALAAAIESGALPAGTVLTEEPLSRLFGTSRTPVRTALSELEARGDLHRFDGRGFVVPGAQEPSRVALTRAMVGLAEAPEPRAASADRIADDFARTLARALAFGQFHIHEQAAADHYDVSRTVVRELMSRFNDRGLVRKNNRSHWMVGPLTARDVAHLFAVREQLEPLALREAAPLLSAREMAGMQQRVAAAQDLGIALSPEALSDLEADLHDRVLQRGGNRHLMRMIRQSQIALMVNRVFAERVGARPFALALREHAIVLEFLGRGAHDAAAVAMAEHVRQSAARTRQRLMSISVFPEDPLPDYLRRVVD